MAKKILTLNIDSAAIRLLMLNGRQVDKWASAPLERGLVESGVIAEPAALGARVKRLMEAGRIKGRRVVASISGLYSISRTVSLPGLGEGATETAISQAAGAAMPVSPEELYLFHQTISVNESERQVFVLGIPRNVVDSEVQALRSAGIDPYAMELKAMALMRAVDRPQALIVNVEPDSLDIVMVVDGVPGVMRTVAQRQGNLSAEDKAQRVVEALEVTVDFYNSHHVSSRLDPATSLLLAGQMGAELALVEEVKARSGYPVEPLAPPVECPPNLPVAEYAVNIGLALKEME